MKAILTGANGYVGSIITSHFEKNNAEIKAPLSHGAPWRLPADVDVACLQDADALIHCAWDMRPSSQEQAQATNVTGSIRLFDAARQAGIKNLVFISSMSAFAGSRSNYGKMKFAVEESMLAVGGVVVRPGLVYGRHPGGMVGKLMKLTQKLPVVPLPCAGARQYLIDEETLARFIFRAAQGKIPSGVHSLANPAPQTMRDIVGSLSRINNRPTKIIPIPWPLAYLGLGLAQTCRLPLPVTTDNLLGLARGNPDPDFSSLEELHVHPKTFPDGMI